MVYYKCTSTDPLGAPVETKHPVIDLALYEGERRKILGHTDVTVASVNTAPAIPINPGDVPERHSRPKPKKAVSGRQHRRQEFDVMGGGS